MPDNRKLYALTFHKDNTGPTERIITLPGGARKNFSKFQKDEKADDYPYVEMILDADAAVEMAAEYKMHGLDLHTIKAPKRDDDASPLSHPQAPTKRKEK